MHSWRYDRLIPKRFEKAAGLNTYVWQVREPWHRPYNYMRHPKGGAMAIDPSAYCELLRDGAYVPALVPIHTHASLAESLLLLGKALFTTNRVERFLLLHKAYESIGPHKFETFTAVRHGLAHASSALSRPKTVATLTHLFGSTKIDLENRKHVRQFYIECGGLLRALDTVQADRLRGEWGRLIVLTSEHDAFSDWQIDGIEGIFDPIPLRADIAPRQ